MPFRLPQDLSITWFGHSTFLIQTPAGKRILTDPFLTYNPKTPPDRKDPGPVDAILVSHGHLDHIADAADIAKKTGAQVVCNPEINAFLQSQGVDGGRIQEMNKEGTTPLSDLGLRVTMTNAFHSGGIEHDNRVLYGGEPAGFVVTLDSGFAFYHAGDTSLFSDMALISELYEPSLAFLPIGDRYTMGPRAAARAVRFLSSVQAVIPMHYGTFPVLTGTPEAFREELEKAGSTVDVLVFQPGETKAG